MRRLGIVKVLLLCWAIGSGQGWASSIEDWRKTPDMISHWQWAHAGCGFARPDSECLQYIEELESEYGLVTIQAVPGTSGVGTLLLRPTSPLPNGRAFDYYQGDLLPLMSRTLLLPLTLLLPVGTWIVADKIVDVRPGEQVIEVTLPRVTAADIKSYEETAVSHYQTLLKRQARARLHPPEAESSWAYRMGSTWEPDAAQRQGVGVERRWGWERGYMLTTMQVERQVFDIKTQGVGGVSLVPGLYTGVGHSLGVGGRIKVSPALLVGTGVGMDSYEIEPNQTPVVAGDLRVGVVARCDVVSRVPILGEHLYVGPNVSLQHTWQRWNPNWEVGGEVLSSLPPEVSPVQSTLGWTVGLTFISEDNHHVSVP